MKKPPLIFKKSKLKIASYARRIYNFVKINKTNKIRYIYPINIPEIKISQNLDFLLIELPMRYMPFMPNGIGYVHNILKELKINIQTVDINIIWYHRYHSNRIVCDLKKITTSSGYIMKDDPWENFNEAEWGKQEVIDYFKDYIEELAEAISAAKPRILGIGITDSSNLVARNLIKSVKKRCSDIIVIVGGYNCYNKDIGPKLFTPEYFDYMIIGEAETTLPTLVQSILSDKKPKDLPGIISRFDSSDRVWQDPPLFKNLDAIDFPRYEWADIKIYRDYKGYNLVPITASRGCSWSRCSFCCERFSWRRRNPMNVVDEIEYMVDRGFNIFQFNESDFNGDPNATMEICHEIIKRNLKVVLTGQLRIDKRNSLYFFNLLKEAGFTALRFGVDAFSKNTLKLQKKGYTLKMIEENLKNCKMSGIRVAINIVIGIPGETEEDINETIDNIRNMRDYIDIVESINALILAPGSYYWDNPESYNILFRSEKKDLYKYNFRQIPPTEWYSLNPYIDHKIRLARVLKVSYELYKNGINIGPFAEETIKVMKEKLGESSEIHCDDIADYTISEVVKIKHNYGLIKKESNNYNIPILLGSYNEYNIVHLSGIIYVIPQNIGELDLQKEEDRKNPDIIAIHDINELDIILLNQYK